MAEVRILVVEDEGIISLHLQTMLRGMGYQVCGKAFTGQEAVDKAGETRPDLILMDVTLGDSIDGIEAARQIVARFRTPVIFLSGYADAETQQRAAQVGHFAFLSKPFAVRVLDSAIKMTLQRYGTEGHRNTADEFTVP